MAGGASLFRSSFSPLAAADGGWLPPSLCCVLVLARPAASAVQRTDHHPAVGVRDTRIRFQMMYHANSVRRQQDIVFIIRTSRTQWGSSACRGRRRRRPSCLSGAASSSPLPWASSLQLASCHDGDRAERYNKNQPCFVFFLFRIYSII